MEHFTLIGGQGFIGSEVNSQLKDLGHSVTIPKKNDPILFEKDLGIVIYCAGHGDCVGNPHKVLESNVSLLAQLIENGNFKRLVYISSTRVYMGQKNSTETNDLIISEKDKRRLFNLTKLVAEELCLLSSKDIIIVRPSNVYGTALKSPLYLPSITRNAINNQRIDMYVSKQYAKDYVSVKDVANAICHLSQASDLSYKIYNIASGTNVSSLQIAEIIESHTGCEVVWHALDFTNEEQFPVTDIKRIINDIDFAPSSVLEDLPQMISAFKRELSRQQQRDESIES